MSDFSKFFTSYERTDPPPIMTEGYKLVESMYELIKGTKDFTTTLVYKERNRIQEFEDSIKSLIGSKYSWGGSSPSTGFDNAGLIEYIYKQNGIDLSRQDLDVIGNDIPIEDARIGDIVGTSSKDSKLISRITNGLIYVLDASRQGVVEKPLRSKTKKVKRITSSNQIIDYFINKGLTKNQARGIYGNLMQESGGNLTIRSRDGHNSYGLAQWTGSRKLKLFSMYGSSPTLLNQLDFIWWELNNTHTDALKSLKLSRTVYDSTKIFMDKFEKPHKDYANFSRRLQFANSIK